MKKIVVRQINFKRQSGAVLVVSLIILVALTTIGLSAAQRSTLQEKMASNLHLSNIAFNAAESALAAFLNEVNNETGNILDLIREQTPDSEPISKRQYDKGGFRQESAFMNGGDENDGVKSIISGTVVSHCADKCPGYNTMKCRIFKIIGDIVSTASFTFYQTNYL